MKQGLTILVDWETADAIMEAHLLNTYTDLTHEVKKFKSKKRLKDYEKEDLEQYERILEGIEIVASWYVFDFEKKVKKHAKKCAK